MKGSAMTFDLLEKAWQFLVLIKETLGNAVWGEKVNPQKIKVSLCYFLHMLRADRCWHRFAIGRSLPPYRLP